MLRIAQGKREPRPRTRIGTQQLSQRLNLGKAGHGFTGQQIGPGVEQRFHPRTVERLKLFVATDIIATILRTVRQERAVRPDRTGNQQRARLRVLRQIRFPRLPRQFNAFTDQRLRLRFIQPAGGKPRRGSLIAGGNSDLRAGAKVIQMDFADKFRVVDQHFRRPQAVGEIAAARFQLRRHRAVQQDKGLDLQDGG